jgi:hypothetical protein
MKNDIIYTCKKNKLRIIKYVKTKLNDNSKKLIFLPQLELGDNIILNGVIRYYCSIYSKVVLICKKMYLKQISIMYSDLDNLILYPISGGIIEGKNIFNEFYYDSDIKSLYDKYNITFIPACGQLKYYNNRYDSNIDAKSYPNFFFDELNLPLELRYTKFKITRDYYAENLLYNNLIEIIGDKYNIIIDDKKRNYIINFNYIKNDYPIFKLGSNSSNYNELDKIKSDNIFNYIKLLEHAHEIHTFDSSIVLLIDALNLNVKTYIHKYLRPKPISYRNPNFNYIE